MAVTGKGFVIDAVKAYIENSTSSYHLVNSSRGEVSFGGEQIELFSGWSAYRQAAINTRKNLDISLDDIVMDINATTMVTGGTKTENVSTTEYMFGESYTVEATGHTIIIPAIATVGSVKIAGLTEDESATPSATQFKVTPNTPEGKTTVLFNTAMDGKVVMPKYEVAKTGAINLAVKVDDFPTSGLVVVKFPIYDSDTIDSAITSYGQFIIYKAQIKPEYKVGGAYKTASTFGLTLTGLDGRRADGKMFDFQILPA